MKNVFLHIFFALLTPLILAGSCEKIPGNNKCSENTICTMIFAAISVEVSNQNGTPVMLDDIYTTRKTNMEVIRFDQIPNNGSYTVLDDSYQKKLARQTDTFYFTGMKDSKKIVDETFVISADCCHVNKLSGKLKITVL